jgi:hypothetical protein
METVQLTMFDTPVAVERPDLDTLEKYNDYMENVYLPILRKKDDVPNDMFWHVNGWEDWWYNWKENPDALMGIGEAFQHFNGFGKVAYWTFSDAVKGRFAPVWFGTWYRYRFSDLSRIAMALGLMIDDKAS